MVGFIVFLKDLYILNILINYVRRKKILNDKELMAQIRASEKNIKKGRIKEFSY